MRDAGRAGRAGPASRRGARPAPVWLAVVAIAATLASFPVPTERPRLVWNASASSPPGLYRIAPARRLARGDLVVAGAPGPAAALADARGYLPRGLLLVKTLAAVPGDRVCADGARVTVNARVVARRLRADRAGRQLPWWPGCRTLPRDRVLLLGLAHPASFDGRYFGPSPMRDVRGKATLLWAA